jgi:hypothetical protein
MLAPRFPAPWSVLEIPGGFRVQDANQRPLAYFYGSEDPSARHQPDVLTLDEARRMAESFAGLSDRSVSGAKERRRGWRRPTRRTRIGPAHRHLRRVRPAAPPLSRRH